MRIAISGAGIAGPTLAYWLRQSCHEPTLIEKAPHLRTGGYVIDFWGTGYTVAERMRLLPAIREAGYKVGEVRLVDAAGRKSGGFRADVFRRMTQDRFTSIPRGDLAATIFGSLPSNVETIFGDGIATIAEHEAGVRVGFETGAERDFDLLVGADGLHSKVRSLAFGPQEQFEVPLGYHVAAFEIEGYRPRDELVYVSFTRPGRQVARFSLRGDRTMFLFVFADEHMAGHEPPQEAEGRKALLRRIFGGVGWECRKILDAMERLDDVYFDRVSQIRMPQWSKGRVALLGDAGACVSLLAGEGTGLAMTEAYVLAGELKHADDYRDGFARYEERLRVFIEGKQKSAANFASSFAPKTAFGAWFRNIATRALAIPPVAQMLVGRNVRDNIDLPDYELCPLSRT